MAGDAAIVVAVVVVVVVVGWPIRGLGVDVFARSLLIETMGGAGGTMNAGRCLLEAWN